MEDLDADLFDEDFECDKCGESLEVCECDDEDGYDPDFE